MIDIYKLHTIFSETCSQIRITNHPERNPTFSSEPDTLTSDLTSPEVKDDIFDPEGDIVLIEKFLNLDSTKDLPQSPNVNPLSGNVIREIEYLLNRDPLYSPNNDHIYTIPEMFTDEHTLDYSSHPRYDDADDDLFLFKDYPDYEASRARGFVHRSLELHILSFIMGIEYPNLIN
ncbi:hypothetical protein Tco_0123492 [Tanacetum coccineum]